MYKIRRVNITDVFSFCRCYGSQRNQPNHYETLCVQNNSSQKEIRDAFLKLSKELHPDIGSKGSHAKFVQLNEAYKILSRDYTRKQYDIDLKYESATAQNGESHRHSDRVFYHDAGHHRSQTAEESAEFERNYYGIKGIKRVSNGTIAAICVVACLLIVSLELVALGRSVRKSQNYMNSRSLQAAQDYAEARANAQGLTREEEIDAMMKRLDTQNVRYN